MKEVEIAQRIVDLLNDAVSKDKNAIAMLVSNRTSCNKELAMHETIQCGAQHGGYHVGMLGILNGIVGIKPDGSGYIQAMFTDKDDGTFEDLIGFRVVQ